MKLYTTLNLLREHCACTEDYETLLRAVGLHFPKDDHIDLLTVLESNGLDDALWCLRATTEDSKSVSVSFSIFCAESVLPIWEKHYPNDDRPRKAIEAAKSGDAAYAASCAAYAAYTASRAADVADAARAAAHAANATRAPAYTAANDARAAYAAARAAAVDARAADAYALKQDQITKLKELLS